MNDAKAVLLKSSSFVYSYLAEGAHFHGSCFRWSRGSKISVGDVGSELVMSSPCYLESCKRRVSPLLLIL